MSTITLQLTPDTERKLRHFASQTGQTLEVYLERLAEKAVTSRATTSHSGETGEPPRYISDPRLTGAEFERLLRDLATGSPLPVLPADFSRDDIYDEHD